MFPLSNHPKTDIGSPSGKLTRFFTHFNKNNLEKTKETLNSIHNHVCHSHAPNPILLKLPIIAKAA
jgi:hypothetical protein